MSKKQQTQTAKAVQQVTEPPAHTPRRSAPAAPKARSTSDQVAIDQITRASRYDLHLAIQEVERIKTTHLHPTVAAFKVEMLEYLNARKAG